MGGFNVFADDDDNDEYGKLLGATSPRDTTIQIIISLALGIGAFLAFCILRPRWPGLYAARKKHKDEAIMLPELPNTMFGWMPTLWKITDQQILAAAGLDAFVFLTFFKMAMKFLIVTLFFSLCVIKPVHDAYPDEDDAIGGNQTHFGNGTERPHEDMRRSINLLDTGRNTTVPFFPERLETDYLWMYVVFAYLFTSVAIYLIFTHTKRVIEIRQEYLGTQTTVTDKTIRLSGIPAELRDEDKIREFIESLEIGKVEGVTLCRNWKELDEAVANRMDVVRRLEEAYTIHTGRRTIERNLETLPILQPPPPGPTADGLSDPEDDEQAALLGADDQTSGVPYNRVRPQTTIWYGRFKLRHKRVDAIDHYEAQLHEADANIERLRKKNFQPTPLAFVTMDSVAACQMAIQAVLEPAPMQLIANQSPAPSDVIWRNTYLSRRSRMARSWSITLLIILLTIFWSVIFVPIAGLLNVETIGRIFPQIADVLDEHRNIRSLVNTQLPTLIASLLTVLVPYLYYWLSTYQGMISQGDVELSAISKNFFFTFFNFFVIFTVLGTASKFYQFFERFGDAIQDFRNVAYTLALSLQRLLTFYVNFIILQGLGLFPLRLLEIGSVSLYPIFLIGAKTPRDYAELVQPPVFSYGFYLPTALLVFIICMVYSVLRSSWQVLLAGFVYFFFGHFVYKYQLLHAMDHQQQSTGRGWGMICDRIFVGLIFFQITTAGQLILKQAITRSLLMIPLIIATIWTIVFYDRTYKPLLRFIALRSVKKAEREDYNSPDHPLPLDLADSERNVWADANAPTTRWARETSNGRAVDQCSETTVRFINPNLVLALDTPWIADKNVENGSGVRSPEQGEETV